MKRLLLLFIIMCFQPGLNAQSPADWWYFGINAGVHFEANGPVADTNGMLITVEGCASMSNSLGDLLFYTDGTYVYNNQHDTMPNGVGLFGSPSSTQSAIIVPKPGDISKYYVITAAINQAIGLNYTLVDMTLEGGLGDVDTNEKNIPLLTNTRENIAAVSHANGIDYWVLTHKLRSDTVAAFEITSSGVNTTPVYSPTGDSLYAVVSSLKGSSDGKMLALTNAYGNSGLDEIKLMEFNNNNGQITNSTLIGSSMMIGAYGAEFSTDNKVLYISDGWQGTANGRIAQYDVSVFDSSLIAASEYIVADSVSFGQIQMGPDGKIYSSSSYYNYEPGIDSFLHRINSPNTLGSGCDFEFKAIHLGGRTARMGLPPFVSKFFGASFGNLLTCIGDSTIFNPDTVLVDSMFWNFGDPSTGSANTSTDFFPKHLFSDTGAFIVTLIAQRDSIFDTAVQEIYVYPRQTIHLGEDTTVCQGMELLLSASQPFAEFMWHDSTVADTFLTGGDTLVYVSVLGRCDTVSDTLRIFYDDSITINLGPDTLLCGVSEYLINSNLNTSADLVWSNGDSSSTSILVSESGLYNLSAMNTCGTVIDSVEVTIRPIPAFDALGPDTINCFDNEIVLEHPNLDSTTYIWSDSSSKKTYRVDTTETVWLAAFNECGSAIDTINIIFNGEIISELGEDTSICDQDSIVLNAFSPGATYLWSTGDTTDSIVTHQETKLYTVTVTQNLCTTIESKRVELDDFYCPDIDCDLQVANVITPNGDGMNDTWKVSSNCKIREFSLHIYNRWGQLVFYSSSINIAWDGTVNGVPASDGIYYYELEFLDTVVVDVDSEEFKGSITLIRD